MTIMTKSHAHSRKRLGHRACQSLAGGLAILCCVSACASGAPPTGAAAGRSTPAGAFSQWLRHVVKGDYPAACQDMAGATSRTSTATVPYTARDCTAKAATADLELTALHKNFADDGITPQTPITVSKTHVTGNSATISGSEIHVSGTTLASLMARHSTGVKPGQLTLSFQLLRRHSAWYVTNINMAV